MASLPAPSLPLSSDGPLVDVPNAAAAQKGFPFLLLLIASPLAIMFLGVVIPTVLTKEWGAMTLSLLLGGPLALLVLFRMRDRWTLFRALWVLMLAGIWFAACYSVGFEEQSIQRRFTGVQKEFAGFVPPPARAVVTARPIKLKLFPLILHSRGKTRVESDAPSLPSYSEEIKLYRDLPETLKAATDADVRSVVVVNWGWDKNTHDGTCEVSVVERKTRTILAATTLRHVNMSSMAQSTSVPRVQPTASDVLNYLKTLTVEAESTNQVGSGTD